MSIYGTTYFNDFLNLDSINNPIVGNSSLMQFSGFMDKDWVRSDIDFDNVGYGLKKTANNQAYIHCSDSSKLFSLSSGYLGILLNLPFAIVDGVYGPLTSSTTTLNEYILWGVNIGLYENAQPGFYAALTPRGIEWTIWTSRGAYTLTDTLTSVNKNTDIFFEFIWDSGSIDDYLIRAILRVNNVYTAISDIPISPDSIVNLPFSCLNTPFSYSNLECTIKKLEIRNTSEAEEFMSSSYSSESSSSSSSSQSSSSSSYIENWSTSSLSSLSQVSSSSSSSSSYIKNWSSSSTSGDIIINASDQVYVAQESPDTTYGDGFLNVGAAIPMIHRAFIQFNISGIDVNKAVILKFKKHSSGSGNAGITLQACGHSNNWSYADLLTWNNYQTKMGAPLSSQSIGATTILNTDPAETEYSFTFTIGTSHNNGKTSIIIVPSTNNSEVLYSSTLTQLG